jgi:hypothetical protein
VDGIERARGSILPLAARRKGIARSTALHLDCARSAWSGSLSVRVGEAVTLFFHHRRITGRAKFVEALARYSF